MHFKLHVRCYYGVCVMKVSSISSCYGSYSNKKIHSAKNQPKIYYQNDAVPSFNGSAGKVIGGIAGFIAITAICPAITMMGLGGLGVLAGLTVGNAVDEKIEEKQEQSDKKS